jgi:hypothetical protein
VLESSLDGVEWEDAFGMTPFHDIIATCPNQGTDIWECLLDKCPEVILWQKDRYGITALMHLLVHGSEKAVASLRMTLYRTVVAEISGWSLGRKWSSELSDILDLDATQHNWAESSQIRSIVQCGRLCDESGMRHKIGNDIADRASIVEEKDNEHAVRTSFFGDW